jgi:hypothetical protein
MPPEIAIVSATGHNGHSEVDIQSDRRRDIGTNRAAAIPFERKLSS